MVISLNTPKNIFWCINSHCHVGKVFQITVILFTWHLHFSLSLCLRGKETKKNEAKRKRETRHRLHQPSAEGLNGWFGFAESLTRPSGAGNKCKLVCFKTTSLASY